MPADFKYDVFLSHHHADKPQVQRLAPVSQLSTLNCPHSTADFSQSLESQPSRTRATLRDTLLPKVLNGEVTATNLED